MLRLRKTALSVCLLSLLLTGCWDVKDLQEIAYLTALGFDLEGEEFVIYGQLLDFGSVSKAESGKSGSIPVWVGKGRGKSLVEAIDDLYRSSQLRIFYGHVNAFVVSKKVLENKSALKQMFQFQGRYFELRYTSWVFGTSDAINEVFSATSIFNFSPGVSVLHQPMEIYKQRSVIPPITVRELMMEMAEPSRTTLLPSIALSGDNWSKGIKPQEMLKINGAYAMKDDNLLGWFDAEKILGLSWIEPMTKRGPLVLYSGEEVKAALSLEQPKIKIHPQVQNGEAEYSFEVMLSGTLVMSLEPLEESELEREAAELVRKQIRDVYDKGLKYNADLLRLETSLYRKKNREWKILQSRGRLQLTPESLKNIDVTVKITRTGNMKGQARLE